MIEPVPPPDARGVHGYVDAPRHTGFIVVGWIVFGLCLTAGLGSLFILAAPSDPCLPGATECGPDQRTLAIRVVVFLGLSITAAVWSFAWQRRDERYRFQIPPGWPPPPAGWHPWRGWSPLSTWPRPPEGWTYWR